MRPLPLVLGLALAVLPARADSPPDLPPDHPRDTPRPERPAASRGMLWLDPDRTPLTGAENLLVLQDALGRLEDRLLPPRPFGHGSWPAWGGSTAWRFAKLFFLDLPQAAFLPVVQHEVYGHGYRAREAGFGDIRYELGVPPPYGLGGGSTSWEDPDFGEPADDRDIAMNMAGVDASVILGQRLRGRWVHEGQMDYHASLLYLFSAYDLQGYLAATPREETDPSNDMVGYVRGVNAKARRLGSRDSLSLGELEGESAVALYADPFLYLSAWSALRYLFAGDPRWRHPSLALGPVRWLPSLGYRLTPFGGQFLVENLAAWAGRSFNLRLAYGEGAQGAFTGADLEAREVAAWRGWSLDAAARAWRQPDLWIDSGEPPAEDARWGFGAEAAAVSPALGRILPLRVGLGLGCKSGGFVPGEGLEAGCRARAGFGIPL